MDIRLEDLLQRLSEINDPKTFAQEHGIGNLTLVSKDSVYPPNQGQETMRNFLRALGYEFDDDEEIVVVTHSSPIVE